MLVLLLTDEKPKSGDWSLIKAIASQTSFINKLKKTQQNDISDIKKKSVR
jgi:hypothetical protein